LRIPGARPFFRSLRIIYRQLLTKKQTDAIVSATTVVTDPMPNIPDVWPNPAHLELMASQSLIENCAAEKLIGFRPTVSFAEGMEKTRSWLIWAGLNR
jgi:hypothetical protein